MCDRTGIYLSSYRCMSLDMLRIANARAHCTPSRTATTNRVRVAVRADPSIVDLAGRVGSTRPAVSRSLKALVELGLVESRGRSWALTPDGRAEADTYPSPYALGTQRAIARQADVDHRLGLTMANVVRSQADLLGLGRSGELAAAMAGIGKLSTGALGADVLGLSRSGELAAAMAGIGKLSTGALGADVLGLSRSGELAAAMAGIGKLSTGALGVDLLANARTNVMGSLRLQFSALALPPTWWSSMIADNLGVTARMAADVAAMGEALRFPSQVGKVRADGIHRAVGQVVSAHHELLGESMRRFLSGPAMTGAANAIVTPTTTTAAFTGAARSVILPSRPRRDTADLLRDAVWELAMELDGVGAQSAARDLKDAWDVLKRRRPGWPKAGPHLMRETLRETLDALAPRSQVPENEHGMVTMRGQVLWMVGENHTLGAFVNAIASNVGKMHSFLSAEAKNAGDPRVGWQSHLGLLETLMGLIRTLIEQSGRRYDK